MLQESLDDYLLKDVTYKQKAIPNHRGIVDLLRTLSGEFEPVLSQGKRSLFHTQKLPLRHCSNDNVQNGSNRHLPEATSAGSLHPRLRPLKMPLPENKTKTKDIGSVSTTFQGLDTQSYLFSQASRSGSSKDSSLDAVVGTIKKLYQDIDEARALASMERISDLPGRGHYERSERQHHMIPLSKLFDSLSSERMISTEAMIITSRSADTSRQPLKLLPSSGVDKRSTFSHENVARAYQPPTCSPRLTMTYKNKAASQLGGVGNPLLISTAARTQLSKLAQSALMDVDNADDNSTHTFILSSTRSWSSNSDTYTSETILETCDSPDQGSLEDLHHNMSHKIIFNSVYDKTFQALPQCYEDVDSISDFSSDSVFDDSISVFSARAGSDAPEV